MAKLSHIDDFNNDDLDEAINEAAAQTKKNLDRKQKAGVQNEQSAPSKFSSQAESKQGRPKQGAPEQEKSRPEQARAKEGESSEDDDDVPFQTGQKFIAVIAFVALIAVILYILNYWFHFV